ncbi:GTP cyclohydrolase-2 [Batrachochytrium salamandrivorans]|nr:GTP cyclohydrolase-2 [Batrachochytrium salamandrivorans]
MLPAISGQSSQATVSQEIAVGASRQFPSIGADIQAKTRKLLYELLNRDKIRLENAEGRRLAEAERELAERRRKMEHNKNWEATRDSRVDNWRKFQTGKTKKKTKKREDALPPGALPFNPVMPLKATGAVATAAATTPATAATTPAVTTTEHHNRIPECGFKEQRLRLLDSPAFLVSIKTRTAATVLSPPSRQNLYSSNLEQTTSHDERATLLDSLSVHPISVLSAAHSSSVKGTKSTTPDSSTSLALHVLGDAAFNRWGSDSVSSLDSLQTLPSHSSSAASDASSISSSSGRSNDSIHLIGTVLAAPSSHPIFKRILRWSYSFLLLYRRDSGSPCDVIALSNSKTIRIMTDAGSGIILYLIQEGRGIGLRDKLMAYNLIDLGYDTLSANVALGHLPDARSYTIASAMLADLGISRIRLLTNNPHKMDELVSDGVIITERIPMVPTSWQRRHAFADYDASHGGGGVDVELDDRDEYLMTKVKRMGHILDIPLSLSGSNSGDTM